ncbi:stage II sporulation protein M [Geomicrobium sp. JCM 19039]|uniref:stage II sporulation protein M n=1 Tax=Geomicrobium sp. JCM 19039 TaxID=1460636 RepID=UPI00045F40DB|nr:stage II sporulation protein M [Geomicrobium sp. JCM 19039]GAK12850.1 stage II sporulation protein M [Geomicrobium sp. JCM 19039]
MKLKPFVERQIHIHISEYRSLYVFSAVLFFMGIIFGAIVVNSLSLSQKEDLFIYLQQFFGQVGDGQLTADGDLFWESFVHYIKYIGLMFVLGLSVIGSPLILLLLFLKGIAIGFTVGFLVNQMGIEGFVLSLVTVLPQNILLVPIIMISAVLSVAFSLRLIRQQFIKTIRPEPIFPHFVRICMFMVVAIVVIVGAAAIEAFVSPSLLSYVTEQLL